MCLVQLCLDPSGHLIYLVHLGVLWLEMINI
jgi:hypothetical protein